MTNTRYIFKYNEELKQNVLTFYENEKDLNILSEKFNVRKKTLAEFLKKQGVFISGQYAGSRKHPVNKYFFDNIDSEEKSYYLGLLYADGSNRLVRGEVNLTLQEDDYYLLKILNNLINPTRPIYKIPQKNDLRKQIYRMYMNSKYISNRLQELGIYENKTFKLKFPNSLDEKLYSHFIRGYFDGDGSISINKKKSAFIQFIGTEQLIKKY